LPGRTGKDIKYADAAIQEIVGENKRLSTQRVNKLERIKSCSSAAANALSLIEATPGDR